MNTIDFEDDSITVDTIIKRLQLHLQVDLTTYHTYLEKAIFKCFDKIVNDELKDEADDMPILETDLVKTYYNDTMYLIHKQSNELFNAYKTGKNKGKQKGGPIGYWVGETPTFY